MAYPPSVLPVNRTNASAVQDNHPGDHNNLAQAINDITTELGSDPSSTYASVQARLDGAFPRLLAWRYGRISGLVLNASSGALSPTNFVTATMVAGRLYMYQQTARAIGASTGGAAGRLQRDGADYVDPNGGGVADFYIPPVATGYANMNFCWFLMGSAAGNAGSHTWRTALFSQTASTTTYYDNNGGFAAIWDLGLDPGSQ